ncbi:hypothetical protein FOXYS1_12510 [Fusarium oxysporum]|uniref:NADPH--cytochrome P450 reductase n=1 Tax=Fusarium oxysporum TaxID=5507 RepID=A0A8H5EDU6_FUSOX|nr:hypothetical protein FOXYS1_12510 [Fusarium oxysporum]
MASLNIVDTFILAALLLAAYLYSAKRRSKNGHNGSVATKPVDSLSKSIKARDFLKVMQENDKNCIVFYGSQTGTAEGFANKLAQEGTQRFGLSTLVADLADYDYDNLAELPSNKVAIFAMASHGEGEPTDNAFEFHEFITNMATQASEDDAQQLTGVKYVMFGLGNSTYEQFNAVARNVDKALTKLGAQRLGPLGEGNDGTGTMEEDFLAWKEIMWASLAESMSLSERESIYMPTLSISEDTTLSATDDQVFLGELSGGLAKSRQSSPYSPKNPFIAPILESRELFTSPDRNCIHMEIGLEGSNLSYQTGDHIAVWPLNCGREVNRFLSVFGLHGKRDTVIRIKGYGVTTEVPVPEITTYDAICRYYLEISAPVSRQFMSSLTEFITDDALRTKLVTLSKDKDGFNEEVSAHKYTIAQAIEKFTNQPLESVPFSFLLELLPKFRPRYYSISSSSLVQDKAVSITAVVESSSSTYDPAQKFYGIATNYLLALKQKQNNEVSPSSQHLQYQLGGPRGKYEGFRVPVHIRHSDFRLPQTSERPIIMVGPGTGVAPFRGFIQERARLAKLDKKVGMNLLFYGCRNSQEDFLYKKEWETVNAQLGDSFQLVTAFSREGKGRIYVQDRLLEHASLVRKLLDQGACFYVCGNAARMAVDVRRVLSQILADSQISPAKHGEKALKMLRQSGRYQEDVW